MRGEPGGRYEGERKRQREELKEGDKTRASEKERERGE